LAGEFKRRIHWRNEIFRPFHLKGCLPPPYIAHNGWDNNSSPPSFEWRWW
jgi:hypothetical protein